MSAANPVPLYGSSLLGSTFRFGARTVQLGEIVGQAFADSGLTVEAWNDLPEVEREKLLVEAAYRIKAKCEAEASWSQVLR